MEILLLVLTPPIGIAILLAVAVLAYSRPKLAPVPLSSSGSVRERRAA